MPGAAPLPSPGSASERVFETVRSSFMVGLLAEVGDDAAARLVAAFQRDFADDVELAGIAGLGELLLLPLAQPQEPPQRRIDDADLAAAHVAAGHRRQGAEVAD